MDSLTLKIKNWLDTPAKERDYVAGATYLLQCTRNRVLYEAMIRNYGKYAGQLERQLTNQYFYRSQEITHEQVEEMAKAVMPIIKEHGLNNKKWSLPKTEEEAQRRGKRSDHDQLPEDIQALYVENMKIIRRMRHLHERLRVISEVGSPTYCPDSDRYPFLVELIDLDKRYHQNWMLYDNYKED